MRLERAERRSWPERVDRWWRGGRRLGLGIPSVALACTPEVFFVEPPPTSGGDPSGSPAAVSTTVMLDSTAGESLRTTGGGTTAGACMSPDEADDWWDPSWRRRRRIEIDPAPFADDPSISDTLRNFPLLLRLPADDLGATWSEREGADLRVLAANQEIAVDYDIDQVDADGGLSLWVKIPELALGPSPLRAWLYYDNPEASAGEKASGVWTEFISVHHLGADLKDSAGGHHGQSSWEPELCDGECGPRIGAARRFVPERLHEVVLAEEQDYDLGHDPYQEPTRSFSITLWMQSTSLANPNYQSGALVAKGDDTWRLQTHRSSDNVAIALERRSWLEPCDCTGDCMDCMDCRAGCMSECIGAWCESLCACECIGEGYEYIPGLADCEYELVASSESDDGNVNDGGWHYVAMTFEGLSPSKPPVVQVRLFLDGGEVAASPMLDLLLPEDDSPVRFGHNLNAHRRWGGKLDEIRIMSGVRSPAEIAADYVTVDQDPVTIEPEQRLCP